MEISALQTQGPDGQVVELQCLFCHDWIHVSDLTIRVIEDIATSACPSCGETGAALRERAAQVKRALEEWIARRG